MKETDNFGSFDSKQQHQSKTKKNDKGKEVINSISAFFSYQVILSVCKLHENLSKESS